MIRGVRTGGRGGHGPPLRIAGPSDVKHAMCSRRPIAARRMVRSRASCGPVRLRVARGRQPAVVGHVSCCAPRSPTDPRAASGRQRLAARARRHPQPNAPSAWFHAPHRWGDTVQTCGRPPWTGRERSPRGRGASQFDVRRPGGLRVSRTARAGTHAIGHRVARRARRRGRWTLERGRRAAEGDLLSVGQVADGVARRRGVLLKPVIWLVQDDGVPGDWICARWGPLHAPAVPRETCAARASRSSGADPLASARFSRETSGRS